MRKFLSRAAWVALLAVTAVSISACGSSTGEQSDDNLQVQEQGSQTTLRTTGSTGETDRNSEASVAVEDGTTEPVEVEASVIASNLEAPWGLAFLPDGRALVGERDTGQLLAIDDSGDIEEVQQLPESGSGEGGLLGLAPSPNYEQDGYLYAYYSTGQENRVVRFQLGGELEPVLTGIPVNTYHDGGRISFGPDGLLYVATGDAGNPQNAQDLDSLSGKILRVNPDGTVPEDNPFQNNPVYSYGHRNVQGLAWDEEGQLFASEFGQNAYDEVNRIVAGGNYGWPIVEGKGGEPEYRDPVAEFPTSEASPSGAEIPKNSAIPQWDGDFFMAALRGERLWRLELAPDGSVTGREELLKDEAGRLRHVAQAPDGSLWIFTNNRDGRGSPGPEDDRIIRLAPAES